MTVLGIMGGTSVLTGRIDDAQRPGLERPDIRRGVFKSVADLEAAIEAWIVDRNERPKPFKWTARADTILEKNARARRVLEQAAVGTK
jgi:hypothetical protein